MIIHTFSTKCFLLNLYSHIWGREDGRDEERQPAPEREEPPPPGNSLHFERSPLGNLTFVCFLHLNTTLNVSTIKKNYLHNDIDSYSIEREKY